MHHLTVIHPFADYKRGDKIHDQQEIKKINESENAHHVVRSSTPEAPQS